MLKSAIEFVALLALEQHIHVVELIAYVFRFLKNIFVDFEFSPLSNAPQILYHHFLVLKRMCNISVLIPFVKHFQTLDKQIFPSAKINLLYFSSKNRSFLSFFLNLSLPSRVLNLPF